MKKAGWKNNLEYFWIFYKWLLLAAIVVAILGGSLLSMAFSRRESALSVMLIDCHAKSSQEQIEEELYQAMQLDPGKWQIEVQTSLMFQNTHSGGYTMTSLSRFLVDVGSEKLDVCGMLEQDFLKYDEGGAFLDLRTCLTDVELRELEEGLFIAEDGRIIGIYADEFAGLRKHGCYDDGEERGVLGIINNAPHQDMAVKYMLYLAM